MASQFRHQSKLWKEVSGSPQLSSRACQASEFASTSASVVSRRKSSVSASLSDPLRIAPSTPCSVQAILVGRNKRYLITIGQGRGRKHDGHPLSRAGGRLPEKRD